MTTTQHGEYPTTGFFEGMSNRIWDTLEWDAGFFPIQPYLDRIADGTGGEATARAMLGSYDLWEHRNAPTLIQAFGYSSAEEAEEAANEHPAHEDDEDEDDDQE